MTRDEVLELAQAANIAAYINIESHLVGNILEKFAELVAAAERESCLKACRMYVDLNEPPDGFQNGVECCIAVITHKDDPDVQERIKAKLKEKNSG